MNIKTTILHLSVMVSLSAHADVKVDPMFSDGMVLQREIPVPVWGKADPGETVTVRFRGQTQTANANAQGRWMLKLGPLALGDPGVMTVQSSNTITFSDVLVGEVWMGSGQSNMQWESKRFFSDDSTLKGWASKRYPEVRLHIRGRWVVADPENIPIFSALGFAFARSLNEALDVPVGMMASALGGQPSVRWITDEMAAASEDPKLQFIATQPYEKERAQLATIYKQWEQQAKALRAEGKKPGPRPKILQNPGDLWDKMVSRHVPYAIRGVLWDQGESGTAIEGVDQYTAMKALIAGWRQAWGQGDFPFLHVQKDSGGGCAFDPENPVTRHAFPFTKLPPVPLRINSNMLDRRLNHVRMARLKNAPLVTSFDLGAAGHPMDKSSYGLRACRVALGAVYGKDIATSGPQYWDDRIEGNKIRIAFHHIGKGLIVRHSDSLQGFEIAGEDGKWRWANAEIDGETVVVQHPDIPNPTQVRYAAFWKSNYANLFNQDGLPALVFSTETRLEN